MSYVIAAPEDDGSGGNGFGGYWFDADAAHTAAAPPLR